MTLKDLDDMRDLLKRLAEMDTETERILTKLNTIVVDVSSIVHPAEHALEVHSCDDLLGLDNSSGISSQEVMKSEPLQPDDNSWLI